MEGDDEGAVTGNLKTYGMLIIFSILLLLASSHYEWQDIILDRGMFFVILLFLAHTSNEAMKWSSRYVMPTIVANGVQGSYSHNDSPIEVTDVYPAKLQGGQKKAKKKTITFEIYGLGASNFPVPQKGKLGTLIVPKVYSGLVGKNAVTTTKVFPTSLGELAMFPSLHSKLLKLAGSYNLDVIYFGLHGSNVKYESIDDIDYLALAERTGKYGAELGQLLDNKFQSVEKLKNVGDVLGVGQRKPSLMERFGKRPEDRND